VAIPPAFLATARRAPRYALLTGLAVLITVVFNSAYTNADISRYYLGPILWVWTWLGILAADLAVVAGFGLAAASERVRRVRLRDRDLDVATSLAAVVLGLALLLPSLGSLQANRRNADRSGDIGAQEWLQSVLPRLPKDAVLVSWWSTSTPLWYAQK